MYICVHLGHDEQISYITNVRLILPCAGEGAGYAGGIISAAVDGVKVGREVIIMIEGGVRNKNLSKPSLFMPIY